MKEGKFDQAEDLYLRSLSFWKTEPSKHGDEARALYALGCLYIEKKNYRTAAERLRQALNLVERFSGPYQIGLVPYLEKYAYALYHLGRMSEVHRLKSRAKSISGL